MSEIQTALSRSANSTVPVERPIPESVQCFVERLSKLERGARATLRRNAGRTIAEANGAVGLFYRLLPPQLAGGRDEELYFLVATLYGLNDLPHRGDFGSTLRAVRALTQSESIDRRMAILLDSEFGVVEGVRPGGGETAYRLRQCVKLAAGRGVGIDWPRLLADLPWWSHPERRVRKEWARSYYGQPVEKKGPDSESSDKSQITEGGE